MKWCCIYFVIHQGVCGMKIEELKEKKKELGYSNAKLAELSGVPLGTIQKIFGGTTSAPRRSTLLALERILCPAGNSQIPSGDPCNAEGSSVSMVCEPSAAYSYDRQGTYTLDDYYALPDDRRAELIDGVFYDMTSPATTHQLIAGAIYACFLQHVTANKGLCVPFISPVDVQLDRDDKTILEPDVAVVCNRDIIIRRCIYGAPDLTVEILSPSTKRKDMIIKLNKYMNAGVREYWIVDPDAETVTVYDFEHDQFPIYYTFEDTVPVMIWDGACRVDFKEIKDYIGFIYDNDGH